MLIVDDESLILKGLKETYDWDKMGFEIVGTALDGDIALEMLDEIKPDIIMTDISMKRMSGLQLMEEVRKREKPIEFVVLSAYKEFEYAKIALKNGALQYLIKPLDEDNLFRVMKEIYEKIIAKIQQRENYYSWKKLLLEDKDNYLQMITRKYLDGGIEKEKVQKIYSELSMTHYLQRKFIVICADLESSYQVIEKEEYNEKRYVLGVMLHNSMKEKYDIQYFSLSDGCQVYLLFLEEKKDELSIGKIFWEIEKQLGDIIISSISGCYEGMEGMRKAYGEALELYKMACEAGASGLSIEKSGQIKVRGQYSLDLECQLLQAIRLNDEKQMKAVFTKFVYAIPDEENGKLYLHRLMTRVEFFLAETENISIEMRKSFKNFYGYLYRFQLLKNIDLAYRLMQEIVHVKKEQVSKTSETVFSNYIRDAMIYIEEHLSEEELSVTQIAQKIHLNPVYFGRVFKSVNGMSVKRYILKLRIERSKLLLIEGKCNVTTVGGKVGIPNSSYFTKLFRENTGKLPSDFLKPFHNPDLNVR